MAGHTKSGSTGGVGVVVVVVVVVGSGSGSTTQFSSFESQMGREPQSTSLGK